MNNVITIPVVQGVKKTKRVVIYARVSTLEGKQDSSYQLPVGELTKSILKNPDYELICIYVEEFRKDKQTLLILKNDGFSLCWLPSRNYY